MRTSLLNRTVVTGLVCPSSAGCIQAITVSTLGSGSAVTVVDRVTTFDDLTSTNTIELGNYSEGGLYVTTGNQSWGADPPLAANHIPSFTVWDTLPGVQYRMVYTENPAAGTWTAVTPPPPAGGVSGVGPLILTDTNAPARAHRFYRVEAQ